MLFFKRKLFGCKVAQNLKDGMLQEGSRRVCVCRAPSARA